MSHLLTSARVFQAVSGKLKKTASALTVNKTDVLVGLIKVLIELFQKLAQWRLRKPPRPSQRAKPAFLRRFSFCQAFSFAPSCSKEKAVQKCLYNTTNRMTMVYTPRRGSMSCGKFLSADLFRLSSTERVWYDLLDRINSDHE